MQTVEQLVVSLLFHPHNATGVLVDDVIIMWFIVVLYTSMYYN